MEGLLVVLSFAFLVVLLVTPFLAWSALNRTGRLQKEMEKFLTKQKLMSEQLGRLQSRSSRLQQELQTLRTKSEAVAVPAETPEKSVERPGALAIVEPRPTGVRTSQQGPDQGGGGWVANRDSNARTMPSLKPSPPSRILCHMSRVNSAWEGRARRSPAF